MDKSFFLHNFCTNKTQESAFLLYHDLLYERQKNINLLSPKSFDNIWSRHFIDSAQIIKHILQKNNFRGLIDIGSGAGFPGLVISLLGINPVYLIESNKHKAAFLSDVIRKTGSRARVFNDKIERVIVPDFNVVISRAFASLHKLLSILDKRGTNEAMCIFLKGKTYNQELNETKKFWNIKFSLDKSITNSESKIIIVEAFQRVR